MTTRRRTGFYDPYAAWATLALRAAETFTASAQVIRHRASRHNNAAQLFEMGAEKVEAAIESSQAMTRHMLGMRDTSVLGFSRQWAAMLSSGLAPFHARARRNARRATRRR